MKNPIPVGYFKNTYAPLRGRDWIRRIPADERQALSRIAFAASDYGRLGGKARAIKAIRDERGRFKAALIKAE